MENGRIPDLSIVASSRYTQYNGPERGRLNLQQNGNSGSTVQLCLPNTSLRKNLVQFDNLRKRYETT